MGLIASVLGRLFPPAVELVGEARHGQRAVVRGRVVARDFIDSPLTDERCVYYRYIVEEWRRGSLAALGAGGMWLVIDQDEAITEFYLEDASGRALVAPERARVELARGVASHAVDLGDGRRAAETRVTEGDWVEVEGLAEEHDDLLDDGRGYRDRPARIILRAAEGEILRIRVLGRS